MAQACFLLRLACTLCQRDLGNGLIWRFQKAVKKMLSASKEEIDRREAEYQKTRKAAKKSG